MYAFSFPERGKEKRREGGREKKGKAKKKERIGRN